MSDEIIVRSPLLLSALDSALVVVDVQEKLIPLVVDSERVTQRIKRLIQGASLLNIPTLVTEQYPQGLGSTVQLGLVESAKVHEKLSFSCRGCEQFVDALRKLDLRQVLVCGIETHVCILQTALDLCAEGFDVFVAVDAVSARFPSDHETALRRMEGTGINLVSSESALFEWCYKAGTPEFKAISKLIKDEK